MRDGADLDCLRWGTPPQRRILVVHAVPIDELVNGSLPIRKAGGAGEFDKQAGKAPHSPCLWGHLEDPFLGNSCHVGSNANPVVLEPTTGTTGPQPAEQTNLRQRWGDRFKQGGNLMGISNNALVNNSFGAPAAEGYGGLLSSLTDPLVNVNLGLPSAAGHNTAILKDTPKTARAAAAPEASE